MCTYKHRYINTRNKTCTYTPNKIGTRTHSPGGQCPQFGSTALHSPRHGQGPGGDTHVAPPQYAMRGSRCQACTPPCSHTRVPHHTHTYHRHMIRVINDSIQPVRKHTQHHALTNAHADSPPPHAPPHPTSICRCSGDAMTIGSEREAEVRVNMTTQKSPPSVPPVPLTFTRRCRC